MDRGRRRGHDPGGRLRRSGHAPPQHSLRVPPPLRSEGCERRLRAAYRGARAAGLQRRVRDMDGLFAAAALRFGRRSVVGHGQPRFGHAEEERDDQRRGSAPRIVGQHRRQVAVAACRHVGHRQVRRGQYLSGQVSRHGRHGRRDRVRQALRLHLPAPQADLLVQGVGRDGRLRRRRRGQWGFGCLAGLHPAVQDERTPRSQDQEGQRGYFSRFQQELEDHHLLFGS